MFEKIFNLQLFATQVTTQDSLSDEMKTYYDMTLLDEAMPLLVHDQFAQKRNIPKNHGKNIEFRKFAALDKASVPLIEGVTPSGSNLSVSTITATISQYGDYVVQSDLLEMTAIDNTIVQATKALGSQAGRTMDTVSRNAINSGTNVSYACGWSGTTEQPKTMRKDLDSTCVLTVDAINQQVAKLRAANAKPVDGKYFGGIIHPFTAYELMRDPAWRKPHEYADTKNIYEGEIGEIGGVRFVESSEAKIFGPQNGLLINYVSGYSGAITSVAFDGKLEGVDVEDDALIGKYIRLNGVTALITDNTTSAITFASTNFGTVADNTAIEIVPCAAGAVFSTIFCGANAYATTSVEDGAVETIVKQKGSAGTNDPLDQRSSVGWKADKTTTILCQDHLIRLESVSTRYSATASSN